MPEAPVLDRPLMTGTGSTGAMPPGTGRVEQTDRMDRDRHLRRAGGQCRCYLDPKPPGDDREALIRLPVGIAIRSCWRQFMDERFVAQPDRRALGRRQQ
jgi:hypothetical protein